MSSFLSVSSRRELDDLSTALDTNTRRTEQVSRAVADIHTYGNEKSLASTERIDSKRRYGYSSYDPDKVIIPHHWNHLDDLINGFVHTIIAHASMDLADLAILAPTDRWDSDRNFEHAVKKKIKMYKKAIDRVCGSRFSYDSVFDKCIYEIDNYSF